VRIGAYAHETGGFLWIVVLAAVLLLERARPARTDLRVDWWNNAGAWALYFGAALTATPLAAGASTVIINAAGGGLIVLPDTGWGLAVGVLTYLLAMDLGEYLFHRAQHAIPLLWAMHSLHHSDQAVNSTTTNRHFWLEPTIKSVTIWMAVGLLFKASITIVAIYGVLSLYNLVLHANLRLGFGRFSWLVNSPQYHRIHHSREPRHFGGNYAALLTIFDLVGGTYRRPAPGDFPDTGLTEGPGPSNIAQVLIWPLVTPVRRGLYAGTQTLGGEPA
jgi:sterol desaturase/sphingolipid hydroxylase (fatty acid hydroxylase superfamily)